MGDMEIVRADGLRMRFTDAGIVPDIVPFNECCEMCNDPRMLNNNGVRTCVSCSNINHIDYGRNA